MTGTRFNFVLAGGICSVVLLMMGCGQEQVSNPTTPTSAIPEAATGNPATQPASASAQAAGEVCVVSGEPLGAMGDPIVYNHEGTEVRFCCKGCVKKFKANPAMYLAKLDVTPKDDQDHTGHDHSGHDH